MKRAFLMFTLVLPAAFRGEQAPIQLPPMLVEEAHQTRQWTYAGLPGFEFLSLCPDDQTREFIIGSYRARQILDLLLPEDMQIHTSVPTLFILYPEALEQGLAQAMVEQMRVTADESTHFTMQPVQVLPGLRLDDADSTIVFTLLKDRSFPDFGFQQPQTRSVGYDSHSWEDDPHLLGIEPGYAQHLLQSRIPAPPSWFVAGFVELYENTALSAASVEILPARWTSDAMVDRIRTAADSPRTLLPMAALFEAPLPEDSTDPASRRKLWEAEAALFMRWAYDGQDPKRLAAFRGFVKAACAQAVDERVFSSYFGFGYARMRDILSDYLSDAVVTGYTLKGDIRDPNSFVLSTATRDQVARIRGDWERRARKYMIGRSDIVSRSFEDQAIHTIDGALRANSGDPGVYAVQGLLAFDRGDMPGAKEALQKAVAGGVIRPMAYEDLASEEYARATRNAPKDFKFFADQSKAIVSIIEKGLSQEPKLVGLYALLSEVLLRSDPTIDSQYLPSLYQGALLYPSYPVIVYRTALMEGLAGDKALAEALVNQELRRHLQREDRNAFEWLRSQIQPKS